MKRNAEGLSGSTSKTSNVEFFAKYLNENEIPFKKLETELFLLYIDQKQLFVSLKESDFLQILMKVNVETNNHREMSALEKAANTTNQNLKVVKTYFNDDGILDISVESFIDEFEKSVPKIFPRLLSLFNSAVMEFMTEVKKIIEKNDDFTFRVDDKSAVSALN
jgi:hypothetical protein